MTRVIAIVEDDGAVRAALASLVRSLGHEARLYASGDAFLNAGTGDPDCLISDIQMPGLDGNALQARLIAEGRRFPIIFLSAFASDAVRARLIRAGAFCLLEKPADGDRIAECLAAALAAGPGGKPWYRLPHQA